MALPLILLPPSTARAADAPLTQSLAGTWSFALDRSDDGEKQHLFDRPLHDLIHLPGTLQEQGFGDKPSIQSPWLVNDISLARFKSDPRYAPYRTDDHFASPFWWTPKRHYVGAAWYQRQIDFPPTWAQKRIVLLLERPHWQTTVWLDGTRIGSQNALGAPHVYELTPSASPGPHRLSIRIDNRLTIPVGPHAHSVTDMTQTDWNGILGDITLQATDPVWIDQVRVFPNVDQHTAHVIIDIGNRTGAAGQGALAATIPELAAAPVRTAVNWTAAGGHAELDCDLGASARRWDEFSPALYHLNLQFESADAADHDTATTTFGLRQVAVENGKITLNHRPIQLRGTLECAIFPLTGYPPMQIEPWKRILTIARSYGLNHLRFHTWCPPEAAFQAADEMGFYFQVECSCWGHFGEGGPLDTWLPAEGQRMLRAYGNHPSLLLMVATNEPGGKKQVPFLASIVSRWKQQDSRRLYSAGSGASTVSAPASDFQIVYATRFHQANGELSHPPQTTSTYDAYIARQSIPTIAHELGQWCVYPDFDQIKEFTGFISPSPLLVYRDFLQHSGMGDQANDFVAASGAFQVLLYKAEIEKILRTRQMAGYQLLDLHDFPGQGYSPVGVLDEFWNSKGYVTPEQYRRFCNQTVLLAQLPSRTFTADQTAHIGVEVAHFGPTDLHDAAVRWQLRDQTGKLLQSQSLPPSTIATGTLTPLQPIDLSFQQLTTPCRLNLQLSMDGTDLRNDWDLWVYPPKIDLSIPPAMQVAHDLSDATLAAVTDGAAAVVLLPPDKVAGAGYGAFEPIFWNRILFPKQRSHTLGILCDPQHPALAQFPTEAHSNWQWWDLQQNSKPMILQSLPPKLRPIVQMIDDWNECRRLGLVLEARLGKGKILICSIDLQTHLEQRPVARQLLRSLLTYAASPAFAPAATATPQQLKSLALP